MNKIAVIGATGLLGRAMMKRKNTVACAVRFEQSENFKSWFANHPEVDTVWYVARACRKNGIRRDFKTFMLEKKAIMNLLASDARLCKIVFASTKVVYGLTDNDVAPMTCDQIIEQFEDAGNGTYNCPNWKKNSKISLNALGNEHKIYALTKMMCESYLKRYSDDVRILRIWDIKK